MKIFMMMRENLPMTTRTPIQMIENLPMVTWQEQENRKANQMTTSTNNNQNKTDN
jgi:hypothetical protein